MLIAILNFICIWIFICSKTKLKEHSREIELHTIIAMMKIIITIIIEWVKISALTRQGLRLHNISCVKTIQQINLVAEPS